MKSEQDNLITVIVPENMAGRNRKAAPSGGVALISDKKQRFFENIPKGRTLLWLP
jgi:hypothetical protein